MKQTESRVLIVADENQRELLASVVGRAGSSSVAVSATSDALELLAQQSFQLILLDAGEGAPALEILQKIRKMERCASTPVLLLGAAGDVQGRARALEAGALEVLAKPVDPLELGRKTRTLVELALLRAEQRARVAEDGPAALLDRIQSVAKGLPLLMYEFDVSGSGNLRSAWMIGDLPRLAGIDAEQFRVGQEWERVVHPDDRAQAGGALQPALAGGETSSETEFRLRKPDGGYRWFSDVSRFDPELRRQSGILLDITKQKEIESKLAQSQKMEAVAMLAGGIAHDFNNILAVILSFAGFASEGLSATDRRYADLNEVIKAANRAARLTRQLLTVTSQQPTELEPTDLNQRLSELSRLIGAAAGPDVLVIVAPGVAPAVVELDPAQFDQVVLNLVVNAGEAMVGGGRLQIEVDSDSDHPERDTRAVRLIVTDSGIGMDERTQQRIFEPFFTTKDKGKGTGLGLATCFGIVEAAGGSIQVSSKPGHGARFTVEFPLSNRVLAKAPRSAPSEASGCGENVLLAEDEATLLRALVRVFEGAGYRVHAAADGLAAKRIIDELGSTLDALVTDVIMPGLGGNEVATYAASVAPNAVVFLTSGYLDGARNDGAFPILWKPIPPRDIARTVAGALAERKGTEHREGPRAGAVSAPEVLVIEDDEGVQQALSRMLTSAGFAISLAASRRQARELLETKPEPSLVLCDLTLSDGSAIELLEWLLATRPALCERVFVLTGGPISSSSRQLVKGGSFRVLSKLTPPAQLLELLSAARPLIAPSRFSTQPSAVAASIPAQSEDSLRRERVLVLDNDGALTKASLRVLRRAGFDVASAATRGEAARVLASGDFSALVVDASLLSANGPELMDELGSAPLPTVVLTTSPALPAQSGASQRSATEYLMKPFSQEELRAATRRVIDAERASRIRRQLLAAHHGGDDFQADLAGTAAAFGRALARVDVAFQPIVRGANGSLYGFEALLRCHEAEFVAPARLLAAAQVLGRQHALGRCIRAAIAATLRAHPQRDEVIFVNVDPSELGDGLLTEPSDPLLPFARRVVIEISERASLVGADSQLEKRLAILREHGYRLALDDLGAGYAGLASLAAVRPEIVKIDTSLVRDIHRFALKRDIVVSLLEAARRAGIIAVAEGIESAEERELLAKLGCDLMQGYLFAKPGPAFPVPLAYG